MPLYEASFPAGTRVRVVAHSALNAFHRTWRLHNPLTDAQLVFAGADAVVKTVDYYHGGDVLYTLEGLPGIWHECCLESVSD